MKRFQPARLLLALPLLFLLASCAAQEPAQNSGPGVEDITPGQQSIITSPGGRPDNQSQISEKNI